MESSGIVKLTPEEKKRQASSLQGRILSGQATEEPWSTDNWKKRFQAHLQSEQSGQGKNHG